MAADVTENSQAQKPKRKAIVWIGIICCLFFSVFTLADFIDASKKLKNNNLDMLVNEASRVLGEEQAAQAKVKYDKGLDRLKTYRTIDGVLFPVFLIAGISWFILSAPKTKNP